MSFVYQRPEGRLKTPEQVAREVHAVSLARGLDELASVMALMCIDVESDFWCPFNAEDPQTELFSHDSQSDDGLSCGYYQQQVSRPDAAGTPWGWGGLFGDIDGARKRMTLTDSTDLFLAALIDDYRDAANDAHLAGEMVANVQQCAPEFRYRYAQQWDSSWQLLRRALADTAPLPSPVVIPTPAPAPIPSRPQFEEIEMYGNGFGVRNRPPINIFWHTQEPISDATAEDLARYCDGSNNVSYHYTGRDRKVCYVVDTDYYSWSVLDANVFSINYCFAGSSVDLTRQQWLDRYEDMIEIFAYLSVQDCRKYGISTEVIAPPYGVARSGISDHKYVTQVLHIGTHVDVGPNFPWDVARKYVDKYVGIASEVPPMAGSPRRSLSLYAIGDSDTGDIEATVRRVDGAVDELRIEFEAISGVPWEASLVRRVAEGGDAIKDMPNATRAGGQDRAKALLEKIPKTVQAKAKALMDAEK